MKPMWRSAVWLACAGCAQLFGIDNTTSGSDAGTSATLTVTRRSVGASVISAPEDLSMLTATFYFPASDPTMLQAVAGTANGSSWSADAAGDPTIVFTLPEYPMPRTHGVALGRNVKLGHDVLEHPSPTAAAAGAMVVVQATLPTAYDATEALVFYAVGAWTEYQITSGLPAVGTTAVNTSFPYESASSITGRPLEAFTDADRVLLLRYGGASLTGAAELSMAQSDTTTTLVFGPVTPNDPAPSTLPIDPAGITARFASTLPAMPAPSTSWAVFADVAPGESAGPTLQSGSVADTDTMISLAYGNPFTSPVWQSELAISSTASRTFTPASPALPATLYAQLHQVADPTSPVDYAGGMPTSITVNGTVLNADGMTVTVDPTKAVSVSFTADKTANTYYRIELFSLVPSADNLSLVYEHQFDIVSATPTFSVPPALVPDGLYTLRATCIAGQYPDAASGDVSTPSLPGAYGLLDSGVFTVTH